MCVEFNDANPIGTPVEFSNEEMNYVSKTTSEAFAIANGVPVVRIERYQGNVPLENVLVLNQTTSV